MFIDDWDKREQKILKIEMDIEKRAKEINKKWKNNGLGYNDITNAFWEYAEEQQDLITRAYKDLLDRYCYSDVRLGNY